MDVNSIALSMQSYIEVCRSWIYSANGGRKHYKNQFKITETTVRLMYDLYIEGRTNSYYDQAFVRTLKRIAKARGMRFRNQKLYSVDQELDRIEKKEEAIKRADERAAKWSEEHHLSLEYGCNTTEGLARYINGKMKKVVNIIWDDDELFARYSDMHDYFCDEVMYKVGKLKKLKDVKVSELIKDALTYKGSELHDYMPKLNKEYVSAIWVLISWETIVDDSMKDAYDGCEDGVDIIDYLGTVREYDKDVIQWLIDNEFIRKE